MTLDRDPAYLWEMLQYAQHAQEFVCGADFEQYQRDRLLRAGVERVIEVIGEAARKVSPEFKAQHPEVPWQAITAQRIVLAHLYHKIDHAKMWDVATNSVPKLIELLRPLIPPLPPDVEHAE